MSKFNKHREMKEWRMQKYKLRQEKLADYFFSLSNTLLGSLVVGVVLLLLSNEFDELNKDLILSIFVLGLFIVLVTARIGYNILK